MNRALALLVTAATVAAPLAVATAPTAEAAGRYRNCAQLNQDYPNGVGLRGAVDKAKGSRKAHPVTNFTRNASLYNSVKRYLDADHDGIACEKYTGGTTTPTRKAPAKKGTTKKTTTKGRAVSSPTGFAFVTPSGNITCYAGAGDVRCDIAEATYRLPQHPSWCEVDYGQAFWLRRNASVMCAGDTIFGTASPRQNWFLKTGLKPAKVYGMNQAVLPYGWTVKSTQIACTSTAKGVTCTNTTTRHGFTVSKASYRTF